MDIANINLLDITKNKIMPMVPKYIDEAGCKYIDDTGAYYIDNN